MNAGTQSKPGFHPMVIILVIFGIGFGIALGLGGLFGWLHETSAKQDVNTRTLVKVQSAATLALTQATHDHAFIYAVCKRFNRDESLSAKQTKDLSDIERRFPHPNTGSVNDIAYHQARIIALNEYTHQKSLIVNLNCPKAMQKAIVTAPTLEP